MTTFLIVLYVLGYALTAGLVIEYRQQAKKDHPLWLDLAFNLVYPLTFAYLAGRKLMQIGPR